MTMTMTDSNSIYRKMYKAFGIESCNDDVVKACDHTYNFFNCVGTFCTKCSIEYGTVCLHPDCNELECSKHKVCILAVHDYTFKDVVSMMSDDTYILHLGHDGVIDGCDEDIRRTLSYKSLKVVEYCGYYTEQNVLDIYNEPAFSHIRFTPIW